MSDTKLSNSTGIVIFAYNFRHRKTQDFIFRLFGEGIPIRGIIAADAIKLKIPASSIRMKIRHSGLLHPEKIAKVIGCDYLVMPHEGDKIEAWLDETQPELGIISGARLLKPQVISKFTKGIINFHPGLIPEARGLDSLLWSINDRIPLGVTSHLIDHRVDAGDILEKRIINIFEDDSLLDLSERLHGLQLDMIKEAIIRAQNGIKISGEYEKSSLNRKMPVRMEKKIEANLKDYLKDFSQ